MPNEKIGFGNEADFLFILILIRERYAVDLFILALAQLKIARAHILRVDAHRERRVGVKRRHNMDSIVILREAELAFLAAVR